MRIISLNANGIRAAARKGFFEWMDKQNADVVCIQETKAQEAQLKALDESLFYPAGYHCYYHDAEKKGYSGVAIYSRQKPQAVQYGLDLDYVDCEGRYLEVRFGKLAVVSLYMQSGSSSEERQALKYRFMDDFLPHLRDLQKREQAYVICGDWNIAHTQADLKNWKGNLKNSGFLPEERAWMDEVFSAETGLVDAFRVVNQEADQYTWWSNRGRAWDNNVGWRIDYQVVSESLRAHVKSASIYKDSRFSDHAPLILDYDAV